MTLLHNDFFATSLSTFRNCNIYTCYLMSFYTSNFLPLHRRTDLVRIISTILKVDSHLRDHLPSAPPNSYTLDRSDTEPQNSGRRSNTSPMKSTHRRSEASDLRWVRQIINGIGPNANRRLGAEGPARRDRGAFYTWPEVRKVGSLVWSAGRSTCEQV